MTYSIVARDLTTGDIGVAVQSHHLAVGSTVPHVLPGVGALVRQSFASHSYAARGLALLAAGTPAQVTLDALLAIDPGGDRAQVAALGAGGEIAVHTGTGCVPHAGHAAGEGVACLANMAAGPIWHDALESFTASTGPLAGRLLGALEAAEAGGGDRRGRQSAALVVTGPAAGDLPTIDLRVDDHADPLAELRRLYALRVVTDEMRRALQAGDGDVETTIVACEAAQRVYGETNLEPTVWSAAALAATNPEGAHERLAPVLAVEPRWQAFVRALHDVGLFGTEPAASGLPASPSRRLWWR